ncbi:MAG TPA: translation elongation factor Ts [Candidatus Omnitrophica bacterium]|nr:translation elongation factor Ts [Candidatus Omnitrophota bacterium]
MSYSIEDLKLLREKTGAGMMDCKNALKEANGDIDKAVEILRKKGIKVAEKKAGREVKDGVIDAYIHMGGKLGVLIEVACETDFVAKNGEFKEFVHNLAMQVAAARPKYVKREDVPQEIVEKEKEIIREQFKDKPEHIQEKIVNNKIEEYYKENCLLEQVFIKDDSKKIKDLVTEMVAKFGENIVIRRFVRFELGE